MHSKRGWFYDLDAFVDFRFSNKNSSLVDVKSGSRLSDVEVCCFAVAVACLFDDWVFSCWRCAD